MPPLGVEISFNFIQFQENLAKSYVGAPGELAPPPRGNAGSATEMVMKYVRVIKF